VAIKALNSLAVHSFQTYDFVSMVMNQIFGSGTAHSFGINATVMNSVNALTMGQFSCTKAHEALLSIPSFAADNKKLHFFFVEWFLVPSCSRKQLLFIPSLPLASTMPHEQPGRSVVVALFEVFIIDTATRHPPLEALIRCNIPWSIKRRRGILLVFNFEEERWGYAIVRGRASSN
jgi:hypothetical protein